MELSINNYYSQEADAQYMSVSQYKAFRKCEAAALATVRGEWKPPKTTALQVGSYVDSYFEGTLEQFKEENPELFKKDGTLKADYKQAEQIISVLEADPGFMEYMNGEKQVIRTAELFGTPWKIKIDVDHPDKIVDLKIMRSMERVMGKSFVEYWGYDIQMAVYHKVSELAGFPRKDTYLAVGTKQDPPDHEIIEVPDYARKAALEDVEKHLPRILAVKRGEVEPKRCRVCPYCRATKRITEPLDYELVGFNQDQIDISYGIS